MTEQPTSPGWYDDPESPEQLRYFDGILWTKNVTPKRTRVAQPPAEEPSGSTTAASPTPSGSPIPPVNPYAAPPTGAAPPPPGGAAPPPHGGWLAQRGPTTADGVPLASYGLRVAAYVIDAIITGFFGLIAGGWFLFKAMEPVLTALEAATTPTPEDVNAAISLLDVRYLGIYSGIALLVSLVYQLVFLTRWSATPGKAMLGISVRRVDRGGVLDFTTASRRVGFTILLSALGNLPLVGFLALAATVADLLWPLSDRRRQALHDKVAGTQVVSGRQTRR